MGKVYLVFHLDHGLGNLERNLLDDQEEAKEDGYAWNFFFDEHAKLAERAQFIGIITDEMKALDSGRNDGTDVVVLKQVAKIFKKKSAGSIIFSAKCDSATLINSILKQFSDYQLGRAYEHEVHEVDSMIDGNKVYHIDCSME